MRSTAPTVAVLLIEDTLEFAELVRKWLSVKDDGSFIVTWADSLKQGLKNLARDQVDVVVLDLGLPDSKGYETFASVKSHAPAVPVIVLSGGDSEPQALSMVQESAQDYINKSFCNGEMLAKALRYEAAQGRAAVARFWRARKSPAPAAG